MAGMAAWSQAAHVPKLQQLSDLTITAYSITGRAGRGGLRSNLRRPGGDRRRSESVAVDMAYAQLSRINGLAEKLLQMPISEPPSHHLQLLQQDLEALRRMALRIRAVLTDAQEMEIHEESVRLWLRELKGVAYDAEDVLDEYDCELLRAKMEAAGIQAPADLPNHDQREHEEGRSKKIRRGWLCLWKTADRPSTSHAVEVSELVVSSISSDASHWGKMGVRIRTIRGRFEEISWQRDALHLRESGGERRFRTTEGRPPTGHLADAPIIHGRRDDLEKVINQLMSCSDEYCENSNLSVLPIVGMGGVGKTALVQYIYNDPRVRDHFPLRGWVCVSDDFSVHRLTARIIESFTQEGCHLNEFSVLQEKLVNKLLDGNRFLLVLDDVWNRNPRLWESLQRPLLFGARGSAVITTTRDKSVAKIMQTMPFHHLHYLSADDCWAVFRESAFLDRVPDDHPDLMKIGYQIAKKCRGLPLAAKSLGSLLSFENDVARWEEVLKSNIWDLGSEGTDELIPALRLSYLYLPNYLKQCFLYTAFFPKDYIFAKEELIRLWMAQGFLQCTGSKQAEDVGNMYFDELVQRSFFQFRSETLIQEQYYVMHDLIHDLAQHISDGEFFHMQGEPAQVLYFPNKQVRHLSILGEKVRDLEDMLHSLSGCASIRTLKVKRRTWENRALMFPSELMPYLEFLRVLDLSSSSISELPDWVGNLKLLRYLNLSDTKIDRLPDSICKLYNLQTLCLKSCYNLARLPKDIGDLHNLRSLEIQVFGTYFIPRGIGKLINLRTLDEFMVGRAWWFFYYASLENNRYNHLWQISKAESSGIEELKDLIHLRGSLRISNLPCVTNAEDAKLADLTSKREIKKLVLSWSIRSYSDREPTLEHAPLDVQMQVMENLQPPNSLQMLGIDGYGAPDFPKWMMMHQLSSLSKLVRVELIRCGCTTLPPLGQLPSLKYLEIDGMGMVEAIGPEFCGLGGVVGFPALEELQFLNMDGWVTWELTAERGAVLFPRLRYLNLCICPNLESMAPLYLLPALEKLAICLCRKLKCIELWRNTPSSSSCSSPYPSSSSSMGPPPLISMSIKNCPHARFLPDDDEQSLQLPATLQALEIDWHSALLVEWCERGSGSRLAHIPNAKVWNIGYGLKTVATWTSASLMSIAK